MDGDETSGWRSDLMVDRPTPVHTPTHPGEWNPAGTFEGDRRELGWRDRWRLTAMCDNVAEHERQVVASHVHQLL